MVRSDCHRAIRDYVKFLSSDGNLMLLNTKIYKSESKDFMIDEVSVIKTISKNSVS